MTPNKTSPDDISILSYGAAHFGGLKVLWQEAFPNDKPWNAAEIVVTEKLKMQPELFLVAVQSGTVVGSIMAGYDGHRGWISRIAVLAAKRGTGIGRALIDEAERRLLSIGCVKINLQVVTANADVVGFYRRLGYEVEERISMSKRIAKSER
jgi:ribosomal protein S18 acetylase RimI-like enzyme